MIKCNKTDWGKQFIKKDRIPVEASQYNYLHFYEHQEATNAETYLLLFVAAF